MKYFLIAFNEDDRPGNDYSPIGGLSDIVGFSEFPDELIEYMNESSFYFSGDIFFVDNSQIFIYAQFQDDKWSVFDKPICLEEYMRIREIG